jgi:hypothetical protein
MNQRLLMIEDEARPASMLGEYPRQNGYAVVTRIVPVGGAPPAVLLGQPIRKATTPSLSRPLHLAVLIFLSPT